MNAGTAPAGCTLDTKFPVRAAWFNAWLYSHQQSLWRALISRAC
jgi:hypothetical protein